MNHPHCLGCGSFDIKFNGTCNACKRKSATKPAPVTTEDIKALRRKSLAAGDAVQVAVCNIALGWDRDESLTAEEDARVLSIAPSKTRARAMLVQFIEGAQS